MRYECSLPTQLQVSCSTVRDGKPVHGTARYLVRALDAAKEVVAGREQYLLGFGETCEYCAGSGKLSMGGGELSSGSGKFVACLQVRYFGFTELLPNFA